MYNVNMNELTRDRLMKNTMNTRDRYEEYHELTRDRLTCR